MDIDKTCCICLEKVTEQRCYFECKHLMHKQCVDKWIHTNIQQDYYPSCPYCKQDCNPIYLYNFIIEQKKENGFFGNLTEPNSVNYQENIIIIYNNNQNIIMPWYNRIKVPFLIKVLSCWFFIIIIHLHLKPLQYLI